MSDQLHEFSLVSFKGGDWYKKIRLLLTDEIEDGEEGFVHFYLQMCVKKNTTKLTIITSISMYFSSRGALSSLHTMKTHILVFLILISK